MNKENWSDKNNISFDEITKILNKLYTFNCTNCNNESKMKLSTFQNKKKWCKFCPKDIKVSKWKGENKLYNYLNSKYNVTFQFNKHWCNKKKFDYCLEEYNILIELDGEQHFSTIKKKWGGVQKQLENDSYKMKLANDNKYSVVRILQNDVMYDKYNWKEELDNNINIIINEKKIQNIYMEKNNKYNKLKDLLSIN